MAEVVPGSHAAQDGQAVDEGHTQVQHEHLRRDLVDLLERALPVARNDDVASQTGESDFQQGRYRVLILGDEHEGTDARCRGARARLAHLAPDTEVLRAARSAPAVSDL